MVVKKEIINREYTTFADLERELIDINYNSSNSNKASNFTSGDIQLEIEMTKEEQLQFSKDIEEYVNIFSKLPKEGVFPPVTTNVQNFNFCGIKIKIIIV